MDYAFGEIDLRWGIFWKRLKCSLDHATLNIEGAMYVYNVLIDFREFKSVDGNDVDEILECHFFEEGLTDTGISPIVMEDDDGRSCGNVTINEIECRLNGLRLRDSLRIYLMNHNLRHPKKEEYR